MKLQAQSCYISVLKSIDMRLYTEWSSFLFIQPRNLAWPNVTTWYFNNSAIESPVVHDWVHVVCEYVMFQDMNVDHKWQ